MALTIDYSNKSCISVTDYKPEPEEVRIVIPDGVDQVRQDVFLGCNTLEEVVFPESIRLIEERAFKGCLNLKKVSFMGTPHLDRVCKDAFDDCPMLVVDGKFIALDDVLFKYIGIDESVIVPECFRKISSAAFDESINYYIEHEDYRESASKLKENKIKKVFLPESITEIGDRAFWRCTNLISINIPSKVQTIEECTFWGCESLTDISLPSGLKRIKSRAFHECKKLTNIKLPDGLLELGIFAFEGCEKLANVELPFSLEIYGQGALPGTVNSRVTGMTVKELQQAYWENGIEPIYIFPQVKIGRDIKPYSRLLLSLGYCVASDLYTSKVAKTYDKYIQNHGDQIIALAEQRGIKDVEQFCIEHGYQRIVVSDCIDERQIILDGLDYIPDEIDLNKYPDDFNMGRLPSNGEVKEFVKRNFYICSMGNSKNAACLGKISMVMAIFLLDGVLKSFEFHQTKNSDMFGSWFSLLYEGYGLQDARDREISTFFDRLLKGFVEYGIVFKIQLPDKSDTVFVVRDFEKYLSDNYKLDLPAKLLARVKRQIASWTREMKTWEEEFL